MDSFSLVSHFGCLREYDWASKRDSKGDSLSEAQPFVGSSTNQAFPPSNEVKGRQVGQDKDAQKEAGARC